MFVHALLLATSLVTSAQADHFTDAKNEYLQWRAAYLQDAQLAEAESRAESVRLNTLRNEWVLKKPTCTTFDCARDCDYQIARLDRELSTLGELLQRKIVQLEYDYDQKIKRRALVAAVNELKDRLKADPLVSLFVDRGDSACRHSDLSRNTVCIQVNIDYKFENRFHRRSILLGTIRLHTDWRDGSLSYHSGSNLLLVRQNDILFQSPDRMFANLTPEYFVYHTWNVNVSGDAGYLWLGDSATLGWKFILVEHH